MKHTKNCRGKSGKKVMKPKTEREESLRQVVETSIYITEVLEDDIHFQMHGKEILKIYLGEKKHAHPEDIGYLKAFYTW